MPPGKLYIKTFCQKIRRLVGCTNVFYLYLPSVHIVPKVVQFDVQVLGPWAELMMCRHLHRTTVVLKDSAVYFPLGF